MPTRIYLVRHGATQLTEEDRFAGSSDVNLSAEGQRQLASLAERLKNDKLDAIIACPREPGLREPTRPILETEDEQLRRSVKIKIEFADGKERQIRSMTATTFAK